TRWANDHDELAVLNVHVQTVNDRNVTGVGFLDVPEAQCCHGVCSLLCAAIIFPNRSIPAQTTFASAVRPGPAAAWRAGQLPSRDSTESRRPRLQSFA